MSYADEEESIHDMIGTVLVEKLFEPYYSIKGNAEHFGKNFLKYSWENMAEYLEMFRLDENRKFGKL